MLIPFDEYSLTRHHSLNHSAAHEIIMTILGLYWPIWYFMLHIILENQISLCKIQAPANSKTRARNLHVGLRGCIIKYYLSLAWIHIISTCMFVLVMLSLYLILGPIIKYLFLACWIHFLIIFQPGITFYTIPPPKNK